MSIVNRSPINTTSGAGYRYWQDEDFSRYANQFLPDGIVTHDTPAACEVTEKATGANMSVDVAAGYAFMNITRNARTVPCWMENTAVANLAIGSNSSGSTRIDLICFDIDESVDPDTEADNMTSLVVVEGTPGAGVPATPSNNLKLAEVTVADGETEITDTEITDSRINLLSINNLTSLSLIPTKDVDDGAIYVDNTDNDNQAAVIYSDNDGDQNEYLFEIHTGTSFPHSALHVDAEGSGSGVTIHKQGNGRGLWVYSSVAMTSQYLVFIDSTNSGSTKEALRVESTGSGTTIYARQQGDGYALSASKLKSSATNEVALIYQISSTGAVACVKLQQLDTDEGFINFSGTAGSGNSIDTRNTSGATTDHIKIQINGVDAWIPCSTNAPS